MNNTEMFIGMKPEVFVPFAIENKLSRADVEKYYESCSKREKEYLKELITAQVKSDYDSDQNLTWIKYFDKYQNNVSLVWNNLMKLRELGIKFQIKECSKSSDYANVILEYKGVTHDVSHYEVENVVKWISFGHVIGVMNK